MEDLAEVEVEGLITFLYYKDLGKAAGFYEVMGFELTVDQGWAKIYRVLDGTYRGSWMRGVVITRQALRSR